VATRRWKSLRICLLILTEYTNVTDTQAQGQTPHDGIGRVYAQHRAAGKNQNLLVPQLYSRRYALTRGLTLRSQTLGFILYVITTRLPDPDMYLFSLRIHRRPKISPVIGCEWRKLYSIVCLSLGMFWASEDADVPSGWERREYVICRWQPCVNAPG